MNSFVAIIALAAVAAADVSHVVGPSEADATIVKQEANVSPNQYDYNYETSNGIAAKQSGVLQNQGNENEATEVRGSYSYTAPDGVFVSVSYFADALGYKAEGSHIPTPQPIPEYIAKSLQYIAEHPPQPESLSQ